MIQGGALRFFKAQHEAGKPMSTIWEELWNEDKFRTMDLVHKFIPKEILIDQQVSGSITVDTNQLAADVLQAILTSDSPEQPLPAPPEVH